LAVWWYVTSDHKCPHTVKPPAQASGARVSTDLSHPCENPILLFLLPLESLASSSSSPSSKRPRKSLILCQLVLAVSVVPLGSRQGLTRPDATFVAFSTVTAPTAAKTNFAPHTLGAIREGAPSPRWRAVHAYGFDRERTAHGSSIPNFNLFPAESQIRVPNLHIAGAHSQSA
jgi:hypothetical protein